MSEPTLRSSGKAQGDRGSVAGLGIHREATAVRLGKRFTDGPAEAGALVLAGMCGIDLSEPGPDPVEVFGSDADPGSGGRGRRVAREAQSIER